MGDNWQDVISRKHPDSTSARDLWKTCSVYGTVVDVFIPEKNPKRVGSFANDVNGMSSDTPGLIKYPPPALGETLDLEDNVDTSFGRKHICIKTNHPVSILESFKIIVKGKVFNVRAKELFTWNPSFVVHKETDYASKEGFDHGSNNKGSFQHHNEEEIRGEYDSDDDGIPETVFGSISSSHNQDNGGNENTHSEDPFEIYQVLENKKGNVNREPTVSLSHPPGFTPGGDEKRDKVIPHMGENVENVTNEPSDVFSARVMNTSQDVPVENHNDSVGTKVDQNGGSVLGVMEDIIRIGQSMGYTMEGCVKDFASIIGQQGDNHGNSGGILCIWEASIFKKENVTISDNFIAIYGTWLPCNANILFVVVYAPQLVSSRRKLWDYISVIVGRWNGESIIMVDFNEVWNNDERRGSCFDPHGSRYFDRFISTSGMVDVSLKGYKFTWSHPSASKMSKLDHFLVSDGIFAIFPSIAAVCLDRHLSNHWSILLREAHLDFGSTLFRFYKSWFELDGFDDLIKLSWQSFSFSNFDGMTRFKKKLQDLKVIIRHWVSVKRLEMSGSKTATITELAKIDKAIDSVLEAFGFGNKWRSLIRGIFNSNRASILVNGSPSKEFSCFRGLKQGDPLAPYPFILIMELLHLSFNRVVEEGLFKGIQLPGPIVLSHLFYADDAIFIGEWSDGNLKGITNILKCFFLASRLHINIQKCQVMGVGVPSQVVEQAASYIGCSILNTQFCYLGFMVGNCYSRIKAWDDTILKLKSRLSKWKAKTLSIGGRLTLLKSVLSAFPIYAMSIYKVPHGVLKTRDSIRNHFFNDADLSENKITWVAWDKVLTSKKNGGLGVSSFFVLNRALLLKWVWRFVSKDGSLWYQVIRGLYGSSVEYHRTHFSSNWCSIMGEVHKLKDKGFDFWSHCKKRIGDGTITSFWSDPWLGDIPLKIKYPRLFSLELDKDATVAVKLQSPMEISFRRNVRGGIEQHLMEVLASEMDSVLLSNSYDRWHCDLSSDGDFRVKEVRNFIDDLILPSQDVATRWVKFQILLRICRVMSSPNHPTSNIKDAFSSNFLNYISASSDYVSASSGKTYSESSNNTFGLVSIALPTLLLFHNDPYMKVMHAYYAKESPIPLPVIMPPSPLLSPMFNPQEFFLLEELLPPEKRGLDRSSSSTSALPQEFEIGESSGKTSLERHEEQIKEILNHLDELSLAHIENIKGLGKGWVIIQQDFDNLKTKLQEARAQIAKLQRKQLEHNNNISLARFWIANLEQIIEDIQARHQVDKESLLDAIYELKINKEGPMPLKKTSTSAAPTITQAAIRQLVADSVVAALEAQATNMANVDNTNRNPKPREAPIARKCSYKEFISYQPFYFNGTKGVVGLIRWFEHSEKMIEAFIGGLPRCIEGNVIASKPQTLEEAINIAQRLMDQVTKYTPVQVLSDHKQKFDKKRTFNNNNYPNNRNNNYQNNRNNRNNDYRQQQNKKHKIIRSYAATPAKNSGLAPITLGEAFSIARIIEACFETIAWKKLNIIDIVLSWPSEEAPPVIKGSLDANDDTTLSLPRPDEKESTSGKTIADESVRIKQNEPVDFNEGKSLNLVVAANDVSNNGFPPMDH
uniref:RNA-directed DNA polymerase, eukaryota n=1 Tax=Tanacetum cinerariifolium TaxID=118510 RepID=A0A6L2NS67_TANCI|nr:RNA-directed DNA polymerase, eukaryota [Tanacetum cinerariifolium]